MRNYVLILMASAAAFAATSASAADAVDQIPQAPAATESYSQPAGGWAGAYLGGAGTYSWGRFRSEDGHDAEGLGGQLYGGYNMQSGSIVYGGEADIGYSGADSAAGPGLTGKQGWNGSVRARVGYDLSPVLLYGTAGVAATHNEISSATSSDDRTHLGYTVGAGAEALVTNNITTRIEYRYSDYGSRDYNIGGTTQARDFDDHSVKVGVGVKF